MSALDPISRRILQLLLADGRASYQAIADEVGLSRPAVMERVKRLEESGHILGYTARLDRAKLGFPITAFVAVRYPGAASSTAANRAVRSLMSNPSVLECHHVAGEDCYILKVAAPSLEALERILRSLREPGLSATHPDHHRALERVRESRASCPWRWTDMAGLRGKALIAYLLVCTVWGSTYLFIRIGVAHLPPFLFAGRAVPRGRAAARRHRPDAWGSGCPRARRTGAPSPSPACSCSAAPTPSWSGRSSSSRPASRACSWPRCRSGRRSSTPSYPGGKTPLTWRIGVGLAHRLPGQRAARGHHAARARHGRSARAHRPHVRQRVLGDGQRLLEAAPHRGEPVRGRRGADGHRGRDPLRLRARARRGAATFTSDGTGLARDGLSDRLRIAGGIHRLRVRARARLGHGGRAPTRT